MLKVGMVEALQLGGGWFHHYWGCVRRKSGQVAIKLVVAVTDHEWFELLRQKSDLTEVNFWAPSGANFKALEEGELFLFKLQPLRNFIVGGGVFAYANALACSLAWEAFGEGNGARTLHEMRVRIAKYRKTDPSDRSGMSMKGIPPKLRNITDAFLESRGIEIKVQPISILDDEFQKEVESRNRTKTKAAEIEHAYPAPPGR
jgi:hypothetical protein